MRPLFVLLAALTSTFSAQVDAGTHQPWTFAVSGDSRNCGNLVMPAIAAAVNREGAQFYWHLGDLRRIRGIDEDYVRERRFTATRPGFDDYLRDAWPDFKEHQVKPFGDTPFFVGIGNHETISPKTRGDFEREFEALLDRPELHAQRLRDERRLPAGVGGAARSYYHWIKDGVDFINLDNAVGDRFDDAQLAWFDAVVASAITDRTVRSVVVGMHEALPHSLSDHHSMCSSTGGILSGERVYRKLVEAQRRSKHVYVLASHSHYYLESIYATDYWKEPRHGGVVLPGWIVGTAGAVRYPLPAEVTPGPAARSHVYGYLSGVVAADGTIGFNYHELTKADLEATLPPDYESGDATFCFDENPRLEEIGRSPQAPSCVAGEQEH
jgi:hypothetical protein